MNRIFYSCLFVFSSIFFACKKNEVLKKDPPQFTVEQIEYVDSSLYPVRYTLYFKNASDSNAETSYRWRFGDGETADDFNTFHSYLKPGNYTVWLTKYEGSKAVDSSSRTLKVDAIPILIKRSKDYGSHPIGIARYGDKIYLAGWQSTDNLNYMYKDGFLTQYDTLWREQWTKTFSKEEGELKQISITADGDVLLPMSTYEGKTKLYRIDGSGNIKWAWNSTLKNLWVNAATEDKHRNIIIMGYEMLWKSVSIQLDATGKENWTYFWPTASVSNSLKLVTLSDGYIIAGGKGDSVQVTKLSIDGKMVWSTSAPWTNYTDGIYYDLITVLDQSNQLQVFYGQSSNYYTFDLNGNYLGSHNFGVKISPRDVLINKNGSLLILGNKYYYHEEAQLLEIKVNGSAGWVYNSFKSIEDWNLVETPAYTRGGSIALTNDNVALVAGRFKWYRPAHVLGPQYAAIFVSQVHADGKLY